MRVFLIAVIVSAALVALGAGAYALATKDPGPADPDGAVVTCTTDATKCWQHGQRVAKPIDGATCARGGVNEGADAWTLVDTGAARGVALSCAFQP